MRRLILLASLMALFMYVGFIAEGQQTLASATPPDNVNLANLEKAFSKIGADLQATEICGWVARGRWSTPSRVTADLGWDSQPSLPGEEREVRLYQKEGTPYLSACWTLRGAALSRWSAKTELLQKALARDGGTPMLSVTLQGEAAKAAPMALADSALDGLEATARQPWSDGTVAASILAKTPLLPPGPFGANIQVAVRWDKAANRMRVEAAWPALQKEY